MPEVLGERRVDVLDQRREPCGGEAPVPGLHRAELAAVDRQLLAAEQIQALAEQQELPPDALQRLGVIPAEVGDRRKVRRQPAAQPQQLDVAMGFLFEPAAGANPVEVAVEIQAEQISGVVPRPTRLGGRGALKPESPEIQLRDKGVEKPNRRGGADIILEDVGQEDRLGPIVTSGCGSCRLRGNAEIKAGIRTAGRR